MAIDYGGKRTGLAVTDDLQLIATGLETVSSKLIWDFLNGYFSAQEVETVVVGAPKGLRGEATDGTALADEFVAQFKKKYPTIPVVRWDERFTSNMAKHSMIAGGMKKKDRRNKGNVDRIAATLMLQEYLQYR